MDLLANLQGIITRKKVELLDFDSPAKIFQADSVALAQTVSAVITLTHSVTCTKVAVNRPWRNWTAAYSVVTLDMTITFIEKHRRSPYVFMLRVIAER